MSYEAWHAQIEAAQRERALRCAYTGHRWFYTRSPRQYQCLRCGAIYVPKAL